MVGTMNEDPKVTTTKGSGEYVLPYLEDKGPKKRETKVDKLNEKLAAEGYDNKDATHIKVLHPTKGFRKVSIRRLITSGDLSHRMGIFWNTLAKAAKFKAESEAVDGKVENPNT